MRPALPTGIALLLLACSAPAVPRTTTPSGEACADMPIVPRGEAEPRPLRRVGPVKSDIHAQTEAERLASLRASACEAGADGVIEAVEEEIQGPDGKYATVSSGTAVVWSAPAAAASP